MNDNELYITDLIQFAVKLSFSDLVFLASIYCIKSSLIFKTSLNTFPNKYSRFLARSISLKI